MKCGLRFRFLAGALLLVGIVILTLVIEDKCETYDPLGFVQASIPWIQQSNIQPQPIDSNGHVTRDKIIVVPALEEEDVSWVSEELSDWQHAIYIVNPANDSVRANAYTTPVNKGHEAMAYLTYIIDHYNTTIPSIVAFLHSHRGGFFQAWHVDTPLHDNVFAMRHLQLSFVKSRGYVNLRCNLNPGCKATKKINPHILTSTWEGVMGNTSTPYFSQHGPVAALSRQMSKEDQILLASEPRLWAPCCAQFVVSREQIYKRPLEDYVAIRQWLLDTEKPDAASGRVMEYMWHVIFGQSAIQCPDAEVCYCQTYGRC